MNALAGHQLNLVETETDANQRRSDFELGFKLIEEANRLSHSVPDNHVSMCFFNLAKGRLKDAIYDCQNCEQYLKKEPDSGLTGLCQLVRVIIDFNKGMYKECLQQLR